MKILHICFSGQYIDGWGYQENLLPYYLSLQGTENMVLSSSNKNLFPSFVSEKTKSEILAKGNDYEIDGVRILRIPTFSITFSLVFAPKLYETICRIKPDVIFHHDVSPSTLYPVMRYLRRHRSVLFVDNHSDELNISKHKLWNFLYHNVATRFACRKILGYVNKFYGVTPARCDFLKKYYGIPSGKISLLPVGADSIAASKVPSREDLRKKYGFGQDEKIIVSGGKMGIGKGTDSLIKAVEGINVRLLLFGSFLDAATESLAKESSRVSLFGWCDRQTTLELLKLSDVAVWPVHHTTLIEDAVSVGTPVMLRKSGNVSHLMTGNGLWTSIHSLKEDITTFFSMNMDEVSTCARQVMKKIDYYDIAKKVIEDAKN